MNRHPEEGRDPKAPTSHNHSTRTGPSGPVPAGDNSQGAGDSKGETTGHSKTGATGAAPSGAAASQVSGGVDVDAADNLGAEFPLRGDQLSDEVEAARAEAAEWREKALRAQAEFENSKKRLEARHRDEVLRAGERVVQQLLPVLDDLERAIDHALGEGSTDVSEGLSAVHRKLLEVIGREGATVIDPLGSAFDPAHHQAVQMLEDAEVPDHTVVEVFQRGYEMHGRVLRPAMVVVSTGGPARE